MHWETHKIIGKYPAHTLDNVLIFRQRIIDNLRELGWCVPNVQSLLVTRTPSPDDPAAPEIDASTRAELRAPRASLPRTRES